MKKYIQQLLFLADKLDKKKRFEEANEIDRILQKKIDSVVPLGYRPNEFDTVQQLQNV